MTNREEALLSASMYPAKVNKGIVGNVGETTIRYVSAGIADRGIQLRQKKRTANPPSPMKIGAPLYSENKIAIITTHIKMDDSCNGSIYDGNYAGTIGDIGIFSFQATKTITTGEGGAICVKNKNFYKKLILFRSHGVKKKRYFHTPDPTSDLEQDALRIYDVTEEDGNLYLNL